MSSLQTAIKKPDQLTTRHVWTIPIPDLPCIKMVNLVNLDRLGTVGFQSWYKITFENVSQGSRHPNTGYLKSALFGVWILNSHMNSATIRNPGYLSWFWTPFKINNLAVLWSFFLSLYGCHTPLENQTGSDFECLQPSEIWTIKQSDTILTF